VIETGPRKNSTESTFNKTLSIYNSLIITWLIKMERLHFTDISSL